MSPEAYDAIRAEQAQRGEPVAHVNPRTDSPAPYVPEGHSRGFARYVDQLIDADYPPAVAYAGNPDDLAALGTCWQRWVRIVIAEERKAS